MYCSMPKKKKLNKLNKNQWFIKNGRQNAAKHQVLGQSGGPECVWRLRGCQQSGFSASLRYIFGATPSGLLRVLSDTAGLRLLRGGGLILLQAAPAGLVQSHVTQHGLGEAGVGEAGPLCKQRLHHVGHKAWRRTAGESVKVGVFS